MAKRKTTKRKNLDYYDSLWSELVKMRAWYKCEYCWKTSHLNSHHIFSRTNYTTRFDLDNGICLCSWHHTLLSNFSAHKTPLEFAEWIISVRWEKWYFELKLKKNKVFDGDYERITKELNERKDKLTNKSDFLVTIKTNHG